LSRKVNELKMDVKVELDPGMFSGAPGILPSGGPQAGIERKREESTSYKGSTDFVFAYRLRRIIVKRRIAVSKAFVHGATVVHLEPNSTESVTPPPDAEQEKEDVEILSVGLAAKDYGSGAYDIEGFTSVMARDEDDDETCLVQVFQP
jgi:hypothetical protein